MPSLRSAPFEHQFEAAHFLLANNAAYLHADMGTGKSLAALLAIDQYLQLMPNAKTLIVTPNSVTGNFIREIHTHFDGFKAHLYLGGNRAFKHDAHITVTSYDMLGEFQGHFDILVLDEAHILRNQQTRKFQWAKKVADSADNVWCLSGTPLVNKVQDYLAFAALANGPPRFEWVQKRTLRIVKNPLELPPINEVTVDLPLSPSEIHLSELADLLDNLPRITKLRTIASKANSKLNYIRNIIQQFPQHNFLIFSSFVQSLLQIKQELGGNALLLVGGADKDAVVKKFQAEQQGALLLASFGTGGVGINLTNAHHVIFLDPPWNAANLLQARDRAWRNGLAHPLQCHFLKAGPVDNWIYRIVHHKHKLMNGEVSENKRPVFNF